jgi:hypothetical protein
VGRGLRTAETSAVKTGKREPKPHAPPALAAVAQARPAGYFGKAGM